MTQLPLFEFEDIIFPETRGQVRDWLRWGSGRKLFSDYSGAKVLSQLQDLDLGINRTDFYNIRKQVVSEGQYADLINDLPIDYYVPKDKWNDNHGMELGTNLVYRFKVKGYSVYNGEDMEGSYSIGSNDELTIQEAEDQLLGMLGDDPEEYKIEVLEIEYDDTFVRPGYKGSR
jgi:hypothetical protein